MNSGSRTIVLLVAACSLLLAGTAGAQLDLSKTKPAVKSMPLSSFPDGEKILEDAMQRLGTMELQYTFLDKSYRNDVYAKEPITGKKMRVACARIKGQSGFRFRIDPPRFELGTKGLTIQQTFPRISAQGLKVKVTLGPGCIESTAGVGVVMTDVKFTFKARPMVTLTDNGCKLTLHQDPEELRVSIGAMNITGLQNDLDPLAKDAFRESLNAVLNGTYDAMVANSLQRASVSFCGKK